MKTPTPFIYSKTTLTRRHGPIGYLDYTSYKPWLRDEYSFSCVYCLEREAWASDRAASFSVDHVQPQSKAPELATDYDNLVYACTRCNSLKKDAPILLNPNTDAFGDHISFDNEGHAIALTSEGREMIHFFLLNKVPALTNRQLRLNVLKLKLSNPTNEIVHDIFLNEFGYPHDLPQLASLRPPGGNSRQTGIEECYYAKKERGELPETY